MVGLAAERATERLDDAGFVVSADSEYSRKVDEGKVISQRPRSGNELQPGSTVSIVVSLAAGVPHAERGRDGARRGGLAELRALGLLVDVAIVPGHDGGQVVFQEPSAGTIVEVGDTVSIYVAGFAPCGHLVVRTFREGRRAPAHARWPPQRGGHRP